VEPQTPDPLPDTSGTLSSRRVPFRLPADYYASPVTDLAPVFPRWVPFGCGSAAIAILVVLFAGGAIVLAGGGGGGRVVDFFFESIGGDLHEMMSKDVSRPDREALESEMKTLHDNIGAGRVGLTRLQPLLKSIAGAVEDKKVSPAEVRKLTEVMHELNTVPRPARGPVAGSAPSE
jgi:hypothetical protein